MLTDMFLTQNWTLAVKSIFVPPVAPVCYI